MQARVWNDDSKPYREMFKEQLIEIPSKGFVEMDFFEANLFMGQFTPIRKNGLGDELTCKRLRLERIGAPDEAKPENRCNLCKGKFDTANELKLHSEAFHKERMIVEDGHDTGRAKAGR